MNLKETVLLASVAARRKAALGVNVFHGRPWETPKVKPLFCGQHFGQASPSTRFLVGLVIHTDCQCVEQRSFNRGAAWTETCREKSAAVCFVLHFMLTHFFRGNHTRSDLII